MLRIYANAEKTKRKEYVAYKIKHGESANGSPYTMISISDSHKEGEKYVTDAYYTIWVWKYLNIEDKDKFTIDDIISLDLGKERKVGDKVYINNNITAEVTVIGKDDNTVIPPTVSEGDLPF